jgi:type VI protein secretion system component VasF
MNANLDLIDALRRLSAALPRHASSDSERRLIAAFRARRPRRSPVWIFVAAAACLILVFAFTMTRRQPSPCLIRKAVSRLRMPW